MLQARENLMEAIQAFLKKYDQIPAKEKSMALLLSEERFLKIKQAVAKVSFQYWKPPIFDDDDDDDDEESSIPLRVIISELPLSVAITPDLPITDSLIMEDAHLNTISEMEADEENESSVNDRNLTSRIPNDIYNSVDACKTTQAMWQRVKRLMQGTGLSKQDHTSRLLDELDKFKGMPDELIETYYSRFSKIMNDLERHGCLPQAISSNPKFLNSLQPE
ncbi:hypothetical protein Tco_0576013 [Tanacetum coccineum]